MHMHAHRLPWKQLHKHTNNELLSMSDSKYARNPDFGALGWQGVAPAPHSAPVSAWPVGHPHKSSPCPLGFPHTDAHWGSCWAGLHHTAAQQILTLGWPSVKNMCMSDIPENPYWPSLVNLQYYISHKLCTLEVRYINQCVISCSPVLVHHSWYCRVAQGQQ